MSVATRANGTTIPRFSQWLAKSPLYSGRNRWQPRHIEEGSGRVREVLWRVAHREHSVNRARMRLAKITAEHERRFNEYMVLRAQTLFVEHMRVLPIYWRQDQLYCIVSTLRTELPRIYGRFQHQYQRLFDSHEDIHQSIEELKDLIDIKLQISSGINVLRPSLALYKEREQLAVSRGHDRVAMRQQRLQAKDQAERGRATQAPVPFHVLDGLGNLRTNTQAALGFTNTAKAIYDEYPARWSLEGLRYGLISILNHLRLQRKLLYGVTKFHSFPFSNKRVDVLRYRWFRIFRGSLDAWAYELPRGGEETVTLHTLLLELEYINQYKQKYFPGSFTDRAIDLGQRFWSKRKESMRRTQTYHQSNATDTSSKEHDHKQFGRSLGYGGKDSDLRLVSHMIGYAKRQA